MEVWTEYTENLKVFSIWLMDKENLKLTVGGRDINREAEVFCLR